MGEAENGYVLAKYDVRGKQEYIFRGNHIKEIVGASNIIKDCFDDYLYLAAGRYAEGSGYERDGNHREYIFNYQAPGLRDEDKAFTWDNFEKHLDDGYLGEVVYNGGGNFLVLYKNKDVFREINKIFTKEIMRKTGTLKILCTCVPANKKKDQFVADWERLNRKHRIAESQESVIRPVNVLPFTQIDPMTSLPLTSTILQPGNIREKVSTDSFAKYHKYYSVLDEGENKSVYGQKILDALIDDEDENSLLALIFIDGNNMGAQVQECLGDNVTYADCVAQLRKFSERIQKEYVDDRLKAITKALWEKNEEKAGTAEELENWEEQFRRMVVFAGDEMSFICKAKDAWDAVKAYFADMPTENSSCAGIAIFHSHAPYAEAYRIAEECCQSGKKRMREREEEKTCYVDFHFCQGGMGMSLEGIRKRESWSQDSFSKPWLLRGCPKEEDGIESHADVVTVEEVYRVVGDLKKLDSRTNIISLMECAMHSLSEFDMDMARIYAHQKPEIKDKIEHTFRKLSGEGRRALVYDIAGVYDLWFDSMEEGEKTDADAE